MPGRCAAFLTAVVLVGGACVLDVDRSRLAGSDGATETVEDAGADGDADREDAGTDGDVEGDSGCSPGLTACVGGCVDLRSDPANCGRCALRCPAGPHGEPACREGICGFDCEPGWWNLDRDVPGCEYACGPTDGSPPPAETCNGLDDNCDGAPDAPGFDCVRSATVDCTTVCGTAGTRRCDAECRWVDADCMPPAEVCNGTDDDCDGVCDEVGECCRGEREACALSCGSPGDRVCLAECTWSPCRPVAAEFCNGIDDDCDGRTDGAIWCASNPWPTAGALNGLFFRGGGEGWAVGEAGALLRWEGGTAWTPVYTGTAIEFHAVHGTPEGPDVWAVGGNAVWPSGAEGVVARWDGASWELRSFPRLLRAVRAVAADDVWAVADPSEVVHWDGVAWRDVPSAGFGGWNAVWAGGGHVWLMGPRDTLAHSTDGGVDWIGEVNVADRDLYGVDGRSPDDLWAVGEGVVLHWDGAAWASVSVPGIPEGPLRGVHVAASGDVWIQGSAGRLHRRRGGTWSTISFGGGTSATSLASDPAGNVWGIGPAGFILRCTSAGACADVSRLVASDLFALHGLGDDDLWAGGAGNTLLHWDGALWTPVPTGVTGAFDVRAVWEAAPDDLWVGARESPYLRRRRAGSWSTPAPSPPIRVNAIWANRADHVWIGGEDGDVARWDGSNWTSWDVSRGAPITCLWGFGAADVWAGSDGGMSHRWDGAIWTWAAPAYPSPFRSIWGANGNDVWAATLFTPLIRNVDRSGWAEVSFPWPYDLRRWEDVLHDVWGAGPASVWAVGHGGVIGRFADGAWSAEIAGPSRGELRAVWGTPDGTVWAVGTGGVILRRRP